MELPGQARPRVSRETRLLLVTILIAIAALWVLARIRFPQRAASSNPVPPLLTQLDAPPAFDDLASEVSTLGSRVLPSLAAVDLPASPRAVALRVRDSVGAALVGASDVAIAARGASNPGMLARDPASGLALVSVPGAPAPDLTAWSPQQLDRPHYMIAGDVSPQGVSLRPVFIGRLHPTTSAAWRGQIWALPARSDIAPGDFLFTTDGVLAGLVISHQGAAALVPGEAVLRTVDRLLSQKTVVAGWLGVEVQALTPALASASGTSAGVMIVWVDPNGPAMEKLAVTDVIEKLDGEPVVSPEDWQARIARLAPAASIVLGVRRRGATITVALTAAAPTAPSDPLALGLTLRTVPSSGAQVVAVAGGSVAARAGIRDGDVITAIGEIRMPSASQVARVFAASPADRPILVAITRGNGHHVLALEKMDEK